nr:carbohydrate-binding domain-containing protein [uncultured Prevotella sp.]
MRKIYALLAALMLTITAAAQTLNVKVGSVTYLFPASQTGDMTYSNGTTLTIMGKKFTLSDISSMSVDNTTVTDGAIGVTYSGTSAAVTVAGNIAKYVTPTVSGAHVSIAQSSDLAEEITYTLSGTSTDGEFYTSGSYKATIELNGLTLTNATPVYSGAAIHVQNSKRIKVKVVTGTTNTLTDAASGSQKGCLYIKGHAEFAQKGTLNIVGNVKHGIKTGEYMTLKNATINITSAVGDGINCEQYFLMSSGTLTISGTSDDGIQCDIEDTNTGSTGETTDHEDEDSGNIYISGGTINITCTATAAKGIKGEGDMQISGGTITIKTTGAGEWDSDDAETKAACGLSCDGNMTISGGTLNLTSTGSGGKGMKCDGVLTVSDGTITVVTSGGLYYNNGTTENTNYTGNTDNISSSYYSAPKGIKAGLKTASGSSYTYSGGLVISGGTISVTTSGTNGEGIESKNYLNITGGQVTVNAYDDAINAAQDLTISGGYVFAKSSNNDGIDANGNCYIKGGVVYAIGAASPEVAIDANTEEQKKLYITGGTVIAVGGLERGSSISNGTCKYTTSWTANSWYALYNGSTLALAFKTPTSSSSSSQRGGGFGGGQGRSSQQLVVYTSSTPSLTSGVTVSGGTSYFGGMANIGATVSGGSSVSLSTYSSSSSGR